MIPSYDPCAWTYPIYRNNLNNRVLTASASPQNFCQIPDFSSSFGIIAIKRLYEEPKYKEGFIDAIFYCEIFKRFHYFKPDPNAVKFKDFLKKCFFELKGFDFVEKEDAQGFLNDLRNKIDYWIFLNFPKYYSQIQIPSFDLWPETSNLATRVEELFTETIKQICNPLPCSIVDPHFQLQYQDLRDGEIRYRNADHIDCSRYALYRLREEKVKNIIFNKEGGFVFGCSDSRVVQKLIRQFGFQIVDEPEENDLILYFDEDTQVTHGAVVVYPEELITYGKWGSLKQIIKAPISFVPDYGMFFLALRKSGIVDITQPWIFDSSSSSEEEGFIPTLD